MEGLIEIKVKGFKIGIEMPPQKISEWYIERDQELRPKRDKFLLDGFKKRFPLVNVKDADQMYKICSRSKPAQDWLASYNALYVNEVKIPGYARDLIDGKKMEYVQKELSAINSTYAAKSAQIKKASDTMKAELAIIERDPRYALPNNLDQVTKVLMLNSSDMPISFQLKIENYTPDANAQGPTQKEYAREVLCRYKGALLKALFLNPEINIDEIIKEAMEK